MDNLFRLNRFYRRNGHRGKARPEHRAWWLQQDDDIVAALRLEPQNWGNLLRGMWVAEKLRGEGFGSQLLQRLKQELQAQPCYCLPYSHLTRFYQQQGFIAAQDEAPQPLRQQWQRYCERGEDLQLMKYQPPWDC